MKENTSVKLSFVKAQVKDVELLVALRKETMTKHLETAGLFLDDKQHQERVLEHFADSHLIMAGDTVIGAIKLSIVFSAIHIRQIQIYSRFQNKGIGEKIIEMVKSKAREKLLTVTLFVLKENPAKSLYLRAGFKVETSDDLQYFMRCLP